MNTKKAATFMTIAVSLTAALIVGSLVAYTIRNESGHSGFEPYIALAVFIPVTAVGLVQIFFQRKDRSAMLWGVIALVVGLAGIALLVYLDKSGTLVYYEEFTTRGLEAAPSTL